tara:strand:+ start:343 stop:609 length:267 start_codon:yes stop_codon:yes gene_type:complete
MKVFTIWIALDSGHTHHLMERSHDGAPLWFVTREHARDWIAEELFGEADWLPLSIEVREIHVDHLPLESPITYDIEAACEGWWESSWV